MTKLALVDPMSLVGKELATLLPSWPGLSASVDAFHTAVEDEHQVTEVGGEPVLVPPLDDPGVLAEYDAVIAAGREDTPRMQALARALDQLPGDLPFIDAARCAALRDALRVAAPASHSLEQPFRFRIPDPSVVGALHLLEAISQLEPLAVGIHSDEPVSIFGPGALEGLARQAATRLQGEPPPAGELGAVLAFNLRSLPDEGVGGEAQDLLAPVEVSLSRSASGRFHGHVIHLSIRFGRSVSVEDFQVLCRSSETLRTLAGELDMTEVPNSAAILVAPATVSLDGRMLTVTAALDGLVFGGARTALELLDSLF